MVLFHLRKFTYNYSWQLILNETIPNGTEVTFTFEAAILSCGESIRFSMIVLVQY